MAVRGPAAPLDAQSLYGEYPFLPGAEALLGGESPSVGDLLTSPSFGRPRAIGVARILSAVDDPRGESAIAELAGARGDERFLSFLFARLVLAAAPSPAALRRWAVAEAKRAWSRLDVAAVEELEEVAGRLGYPTEREEGRLSFALPDYLRLATGIREADFRLARQDVARGRVTVERKRAARLVQEAIRRTLAVPVAVHPAVVALVRERHADLFEQVTARLPSPVARPGATLGAIRRDRFPPCIRRMARTLERGENLSHAGRFCLAAFLHRAGADAETIVDAYRGAPDFDESITRYQVEHITSRGGGEGYEPPECDTLRSHGLCARDGDPDAPDAAGRARDPLCFEPFLKHPLQYYRIRGGAVAERARPDDGPPPTEARAPGTSGGRARPRSTARR